MNNTDMEPEISIRAEPITPEACRFTVDRPLLPAGARFFGSKDAAKGSSIAEAILAVEGITSVLFADNTVTVNKSSADDWRPIARQVGAAIRSALQTGAPLFSQAVLAWNPPTEEIRSRVEQLLASEINPAVANHGGQVSLVDVRGNSVFLQLSGGCQGCGMAEVTLRQGIETTIRQRIPEVGEILDTTDHAGGRNPYYAPRR